MTSTQCILASCARPIVLFADLCDIEHDVSKYLWINIFDLLSAFITNLGMYSGEKIQISCPTDFKTFLCFMTHEYALTD